MAKIKFEIATEIFKSHNQIRFSRTKNWSYFLHLRILIITYIYDFIGIQQGTWNWTNIISANIRQLVFFFGTYQHVIFNGYLGVQVPTAFYVSFFYKKVLVLIIFPWNAIQIACVIIKPTIKDNICIWPFAISRTSVFNSRVKKICLLLTGHNIAQIWGLC